MIDLIERWLLEHTGSAVQKERVQLVKEQAEQLQRQLASVSAERDALKAERDALAAQVQEIRRLQEEADRQRSDERARGDAVPGDGLRVLRAIANSELSPDDVGLAVQLSAQRALLLLQALKRDGYAVELDPKQLDPWSRSPCRYSASAPGLELLDRRGALD